MRKLKRDGEAKNVSIRYDLATLRVELSKKETELVINLKQIPLLPYRE